jgi:hypothetical protein
MSLPETITLDVSNLLTAGGVFVAILAAIYSARSARAAQRQAEAADAAVAEVRAQTKVTREALNEACRQNQIAGHGHRPDAYRALLAFRGRVTTTGVSFSSEPIWALWKHAHVAEFYFTDGVAKRFTGLVDSARFKGRMRTGRKLRITQTRSDRRECERRTWLVESTDYGFNGFAYNEALPWSWELT